MTSSNLKRKESNKKSSQKYYEKNKDAENKKASERMRKLRWNRAIEKIMTELKAGREATSSTELKATLSTELPKESRRSTSTGDNVSDAGHSERSVTPDHLRWPTPEYLRDYEWEAQMEELKKRNEDERM